MRKHHGHVRWFVACYLLSLLPLGGALFAFSVVAQQRGAWVEVPSLGVRSELRDGVPLVVLSGTAVVPGYDELRIAESEATTWHAVVEKEGEAYFLTEMSNKPETQNQRRALTDGQVLDCAGVAATFRRPGPYYDARYGALFPCGFTFAALGFAALLLVRRRLTGRNFLVLPAVLTLCAIGLVIAYRLTVLPPLKDYFWKQMTHVGLGLMVLAVVWRLDFDRLGVWTEVTLWRIRQSMPVRRLVAVFRTVTLIATAERVAAAVPITKRLGRRASPYLSTVSVGNVLLAGAVAGLFVVPLCLGTRQFLRLGPLGQFKPSEVATLLLVVFLAKGIVAYGLWQHPAQQVAERLVLLVVLLGGAAIAMAMYVTQRDLGPMTIFFGTFLAVLLIGTWRWPEILICVGCAVIAAAALYQLDFLPQHDKVASRFDLWQNPWIFTKGEQIVRGLWSIAAGGTWGKGLGGGYYAGLPALETDYAFSVVCQEMGLAGGMIVLVAGLVLFGQGMMAARSARRKVYTLVAAGCTVLVTLELLVIVAGVTGVTPLTGVTCPFISRGGTSIVAVSMAWGLVANVGGHDYAAA